MWVQLSIADHARKRIRAARVLCQVIALVVMVPSLTRAQGRFVDREPQIKAVYVYKFIAYTQWPAGSFVSKDAALVIGTVGDDPVNKYLKLITQKRKGGSRDLVYRSITEPNKAAGCHLIFVSDKAAKELVDAVFSYVRKKPVLLIGETPEFASRGGVIGLNVIDNKVRLSLCLKAASHRNLKIGSQLAKLARIVEQNPAPAESLKAVGRN